MRQKITAVIFAVVICYASLWLGNDVVRWPNIYMAFLAGLIPAAVCLWIIIRNKHDREFLLRLFIVALFLRYAVGYLIYYKHLQPFLGGDAETYDAFGNA